MNYLKGYQYYTDKDTGEEMAVSKKTGEVTETKTVIMPVGTMCQTKDQRIANEYRKKVAEEMRKHEKRDGSKKPQFTGVSIATHFGDLSKNTLARLIYLATKISYIDNVLMKTERTIITRKMLPKILNVSKRTAARFWNEVSPKYITEDSDGKLIFNKDIFAKGDIKKKIGFFIRVYAEGLSALYNSVPNSKHRYLGYIFSLLPYVNIEHNILCYNPYETDIENIVPMSMEEFCNEIGFTYSHIERLHTIFKGVVFKTKDGRKGLFCSVIRNEYTGKRIMVVNPYVLYGGTNPEAVLEFGAFFK